MKLLQSNFFFFLFFFQRSSAWRERLAFYLTGSHAGRPVDRLPAPLQVQEARPGLYSRRWLSQSFLMGVWEHVVLLFKEHWKLGHFYFILGNKQWERGRWWDSLLIKCQRVLSLNEGQQPFGRRSGWLFSFGFNILFTWHEPKTIWL